MRSQRSTPSRSASAAPPTPACGTRSPSRSTRRAWALEDLGWVEEAIAAFGEFAARFGDAPESQFRRWAARALMRRGWLLSGDRAEDAIAAYRDLVVRFGEDEAAPPYDIVCAIHNRALLLDGLGRHEEAVADFDDVLARFADTAERDVADMVELSLAAKAAVLMRLGEQRAASSSSDGSSPSWPSAPWTCTAGRRPRSTRSRTTGTSTLRARGPPSSSARSPTATPCSPSRDRST
jgi:tetratricopeptide (TPR) repeat protein